MSEWKEYTGSDEQIAEILKTRDTKEQLDNLDPSIEQEFLAFSEVRLRNEMIEELRAKKLLEKFGSGYALKKACNSEEYRKAYEEAKKEIDEEV